MAYLASLCSLVDEISCRLFVSAVISLRSRSSWFWSSCRLSSSRCACLSYRSKNPIIPFNTLSSRIILFLSLFCKRTFRVNLLTTLFVKKYRIVLKEIWNKVTNINPYIHTDNVRHQRFEYLNTEMR